MVTGVVAKADVNDASASVSITSSRSDVVSALVLRFLAGCNWLDS